MTSQRRTSVASESPRYPIMKTVRRSFSMARKRASDVSAPGMYSTAEERHPYCARRQSVNPPTVEQIAMGLHLSRTPHLPTAARGPPPPLPPPPSRSSLKHTPTAPTASSTTITDVHTTRTRSRVSQLMSRFRTAPQHKVELRPPKKAVRFTDS